MKHKNADAEAAWKENSVWDNIREKDHKQIAFSPSPFLL
jgi:hypothetical protein